MRLQIVFLVLTFYLAGFAPMVSAHDKAELSGEQAYDERSILQEWIAGKKVRLASVNRFGMERCFVSLQISDAIFKRMYKKSYKADCPIPRSELRYVKVLHYNLNHEICLGEIVCNQAIANDLLEIFKTLFKAKYPIERMVLIDHYNADDELSMQANNSSCFNFRRVSGSKKLSHHSTGRAIDINPKYNPMVKVRDGNILFSPKNAKSYMDRSANFPYKIDRNDLCYKEFRKRGFIWGGAWKSVKDYQHFEKPAKNLSKE